MAPTTAQIMTENTAGQTYRATYSPDDNKLRLYASLRLDEETYSLINKAGFRWAPKQELFVAPAWTPGREDVLLSLAGDIEDEDSTLFDRQEQRAGRFSDYSDRRAVESEQALAHVDSLASAVPLGQPILVGHHSERRARRHAQKIENGMKRAVMLFERAEYWEQRAQASLRHAKYKERPDVRYRRIKKIEAELRKSQKHIARSEEYMTMWRAQTLDLKWRYWSVIMTYLCLLHARQIPPPGREKYEGSMSSILPCLRRSLLLNRRVILRSAVMSARLATNSAGLIITRTAWPTNARCSMKMVALSPEHRNLNQAGRY
ncbi:hypothetical protein BANRA_05550 [Klebsiella pneumoniae]|nr:hypothetical protein BANRA_05550 [Klebsiella pneumoniae]